MSSQEPSPSQEEIMDEEFLRGLDSIIGPMKASGASQEDIDNITARAKQFYLSRRPAPAEAAASVIQEHPQRPGHTSTEQFAGDSNDLEQSRGQMLAPDEPADDQPRYPLSFDELAEMIATGAHIPGIREIPDKLNEEPPSEPVLAKTQVRKPWEGAPQIPQEASSLSAILGKKDDDGAQD